MQSIRYHYMDNLRAIAMLVGVVFHAMLAYVPNMQEVWFGASLESSPVLGMLAWFLHMFRMPLFFLIAGFFAAYLVNKRGIAGLMKNRALRLALPFVIFFPLVLISIVAGFQWALQNIDNPSPMLQTIGIMMSQPDAPQPPPSTTHLWFIYNLFMFCVVYALVRRFGNSLRALVDRIISARFLVFVLPMLMIPALATQMEPHPAPERFTPQLWSFGYYGLFFLVGSLYFRRQSLLDELRPYLPLMLVAGVGLYIAFYLQLPAKFTIDEAMAAAMAGVELNARQIAMSTAEAFISVHLTLASLILGKDFLDRANKTVRFIADSSYWIYIMHLPALFFIQYLLLDVNLNLWIELIISTFGTLALGMLSYVLLIRWTPVGWMLNGRQRKPGVPKTVPV